MLSPLIAVLPITPTPPSKFFHAVKEEVKSFLSLLGLEGLQLKIIHMPKGHIMGWDALLPYIIYPSNWLGLVPFRALGT